MKPVITFSGPHGGGKTYLIDRLLERRDEFTPPVYEVDFLSEFTSFKSLLDWERSLVRLYHRHFISSTSIQREVDGRCTVLSRGVLDSEAYIETYFRLGLVNGKEYRVLRDAVDSIPVIPPSVVLVPEEKTLRARLEGRIDQEVRSNRDQIFKREDQLDFLLMLSQVFREFRDRPGVFYLTDNESEQQDEIITWALG